jgi:hypothetical protein
VNCRMRVRDNSPLKNSSSGAFISAEP